MSFVGRKEGRKVEVEVDVVVGYNLDDDFQTEGHSSQLRKFCSICDNHVTAIKFVPPIGYRATLC